MSLPDNVLKALEGHSMKLERIAVPQFDHYSELLTRFPRAEVSSYTKTLKPDVYNEYKSEMYPRLFGVRITRHYTPEILETAAKALYQEIDRVFLPSQFEYRDGGIPTNSPFKKVSSVQVWIPLELVPLPLTLEFDYALRIVLNVQYEYNVPVDSE